MIFVVVGMHTVGFDRLLRIVDEAAPRTNETWIAQIGHSTYVPANLQWFRFCTPEDFAGHFSRASWMVTHGGYTIIEAILAEKHVVAIPRRREFNEHID